MGNIISPNFFEHWILHRHVKNRKSVMSWSIKKSPLTQNSNNQKRMPPLLSSAKEYIVIHFVLVKMQNTEEKKKI